MNPIHRLFALSLTTGALFAGSTLQAAAQPVHGCPIATDAVVSQMLGPSARGAGFQAPGGRTVCNFVNGDQTIGMLYVTNAFTGDDPKTPLATTQNGTGQDDPGYAVTDVSGIGDVARLTTARVGDETVYNLVVQRGSEWFEFHTNDDPDAPTTLTAVATVVLANVGQ